MDRKTPPESPAAPRPSAASASRQAANIPEPAPAAERRRAARAASLALSLAVLAALAWWTWGRTLDVLIDYGGELYFAWRIREGDVLYRDLACFTGPLSHHLDALAFLAFGTGWQVLAAVNLAWIAASAWLLHHLVERIAGLLAAGAASVLFLVAFAFGHLQPYGTYNLVTPYSHEMVHGTALALAALAVLGRWLRAPRRRWVAPCGALFGLIALTKPEFTLAAGLALACGAAAGWRLHGRRLAGRARDFGLFAACALAPPLLAWALLASAMPAGEALRGVLGSWPHLLGSEVAELPFYRSLMGLDRPLAHLRAIALSSAVLAAACGAWAGLALLARAPRRALWAAPLALAVPAAAWAWLPAERWLDATRPLPLVAAACAAGCALAFARRRGDPQLGARWALAGCSSVYALALLAKIALAVRPEHYGFALAAPAAALLVAATVGWLPAWAARRGGSALVAQAGALGGVAAVLAAALTLGGRFLSWQRFPVASGRDAFLADERGPFVQRAVQALGRRHAAARTVLVLPEGAMLNYLARKPAPTRHVSFMPPEMLMFGEQEMLAALRASPPDRVVLVHRVTHEYGTPLFGRDYGGALAAWVAQRYAPVQTFGDPPLRPQTRFGIQILAPRE